MRENRCPNCELLNLPAATECLQCRTPLPGETATPAPPTERNIPAPPTASGSARPTAGAVRSGAENRPPPIPYGIAGSPVAVITKTGSRTYFWYRVFCSLIVIPSVVLAIFGGLAIIGSFGEEGQEAADALAGGILFLLVGAPAAVLYFFGVVLPAKPFHWYYGIFLLGLGILSCGLAPAAIPLLYFWFKPETQTFFERR